MSAKVEAGTYQVKTTGATIYEAPSGAVMCRIGIDLGLTGGICLIQKDGTLSERGFKDVQAILGLTGPWDWSAWSCEPEEFAGHDVEAVVEVVQGEKGEFSSVKYLNVPGGQKMEKADAKTLAAKYGAKTRALFGGVPAGKPPVPKAKTPPPKPAGASSTMEACWEKWCESNDGDPDAWYAAVKDATGKEQNACKPEDWGKMMTKLSDNIPM